MAAVWLNNTKIRVDSGTDRPRWANIAGEAGEEKENDEDVCVTVRGQATPLPT